MLRGLIVTSKFDISTINAVENDLKNDFEFFRLDIDNIIENRISIINKNEDIYLDLNGKIIGIKAIDFVWYRRFSFIESSNLLNILSKERTSEFNFYVYTEYKQTVLSILNLLKDKVSINKFETFYNSNNKIANLHLASKLGFKTPNSIISNDYEQIKTFGF